MTHDLPPELDLDEDEIEALFARFRIPLEEAREILQQTILTLLIRYPDLRSPQLWVMRTLKRRCVLWCRERMRRIHWIFDVGFREALTSTDYPEEERDGMRENLRQWTASVAPRCRDLLRRRYGLAGDDVTPPPEMPAEEDSDPGYLQDLVTRVRTESESEHPGLPSDEVLRCVGALVRRIRAEQEVWGEGLWEQLEEQEDDAADADVESDETAEEEGDNEADKEADGG